MTQDLQQDRRSEAWPIEWTPDQVTRFWDWYASRPEIQRPDHADHFAGSVIAFARQYIHDFGLTVDYACGLGTLTGQLVRRHVRTWAFDVSDASVAHVRHSLSGYPDFLGADGIVGMRAPLEDACVDTVFLVETIEHLKDDALTGVLRDIHRILMTGGSLVVTTPNQENLAASAIVCPNCLCEYHKGQHVRAWSKDTLVACLRRHGFDARLCTARLLSDQKGLRRWAQQMRVALRGHTPHLVAIAHKTSEHA